MTTSTRIVTQRCPGTTRISESKIDERISGSLLRNQGKRHTRPDKDYRPHGCSRYDGLQAGGAQAPLYGEHASDNHAHGADVAPIQDYMLVPCRAGHGA